MRFLGILILVAAAMGCDGGESEMDAGATDAFVSTDDAGDEDAGEVAAMISIERCEVICAAADEMGCEPTVCSRGSCSSEVDFFDDIVEVNAPLGCDDEARTLVACEWNLDACDECGSPYTALTDCQEQFCLDNPDSEFCG